MFRKCDDCSESLRRWVVEVSRLCIDLFEGSCRYAWMNSTVQRVRVGSMVFNGCSCANAPPSQPAPADTKFCFEVKSWGTAVCLKNSDRARPLHQQLSNQFIFQSWWTSSAFRSNTLHLFLVLLSGDDQIQCEGWFFPNVKTQPFTNVAIFIWCVRSTLPHRYSQDVSDPKRVLRIQQRKLQKP